MEEPDKSLGCEKCNRPLDYDRTVDRPENPVIYDYYYCPKCLTVKVIQRAR
jgi:hypothetical protein